MHSFVTICTCKTYHLTLCCSGWSVQGVEITRRFLSGMVVIFAQVLHNDNILHSYAVGQCVSDPQCSRP